MAGFSLYSSCTPCGSPYCAWLARCGREAIARAKFAIGPVQGLPISGWRAALPAVAHAPRPTLCPPPPRRVA